MQKKIPTTLEYYVNDISQVLSPGAGKRENEVAKNIDTQTTHQVVSLIFPHRNGRELRDIGLEIFNENGIGQKGKNNGLLLIIASDEKKIRIIVGKGLEWVYTNAWCKNIITKELRPLLDSGDYDGLIRLWHNKVQERLSWGEKNKHIGRNFIIKCLGFWTLFCTLLGFSVSFLEKFGFREITGYLSILFAFLFLIFIKSSKSTKIILITLYIVILCITYRVEQRNIYCENNVYICEQQRIEREASVEHSQSSSSSSSWGSAGGSSSSFGGGGGSSNGGGWGD